jgi:ADP-ribose pyrophosphatase YjhB (NUDIX family)
MTETNISKKELNLLLSLLRKIKPGCFPHDLFVEFYRLNKLTAFELVPIIRNSANSIKVILVKRSDTDLIWPGMYHLPGTVIRSHDTEESAFSRLFSKELGNPEVLTEPEFSHYEFVETERGRGIALVYWVEIKKVSGKGKAFEIDNLPKNTHKNHLLTIKRIMKSF